jgi:hypothetical protein
MSSPTQAKELEKLFEVTKIIRVISLKLGPFDSNFSNSYSLMRLYLKNKWRYFMLKKLLLCLSLFAAQNQTVKSMDSAQQLPMQLLAGLAMGTCSRLSTYLATSLSIRNTYDSIESEVNQEKYRLVYRPVYSTCFQAPKFNLELQYKSK